MLCILQCRLYMYIYVINQQIHSYLDTFVYLSFCLNPEAFPTLLLHALLSSLTRNVFMTFSLTDAISIEKLLFSPIAIASGSSKYLLFSRLCKHHFNSKGIYFLITIGSQASTTDRHLWSLYLDLSAKDRCKDLANVNVNQGPVL